MTKSNIHPLHQLMRPLRWAGNMVVSVWSRAMGNGVTGTASQFAYNAFLATIPFLFVVVTAIRFAGPESYTSFFDNLEETIPGISGLAESFTRATKAGAVGGMVIALASIVSLYVSSNAIGALVDGLDRAQRIPHRKWIRAKVYNMVLAAGTIILAAIGAASLTGSRSVVEFVTRNLGGGRDVQQVVNNLTLPIGLLLVFVFTMALYRYGPNELRLGFRAILPGALLSTAAWYVTNLLVSLYATVVGNLAAVYGALGALFVYLTFLYFSGLMFLVGAELNAELIHRRVNRNAAASLMRASNIHGSAPTQDRTTETEDDADDEDGSEPTAEIAEGTSSDPPEDEGDVPTRKSVVGADRPPR